MSGRGGYPVKSTTPCVCKQCGVTYKPKTKDRTAYCGRACYYAHKTATKRAGPTERHVACKGCGVEFTTTHKMRAWCGNACRKRHELQDALRLYRERRPTLATCASCGEQFQRPYRRGIHKTCSELCARRMAAAGIKAQKARRRARKRGAFIETVRDAVVIARDKGMCHICGKTVNLKALVPHPKAPTLDHVIPLSRGGEHSYRNVRLAHFICNSVKGSSAMGQSRLLA